MGRIRKTLLVVYIYLLSNQIYRFSDLGFLEPKDTEAMMDNPGIHSRSCVEWLSPLFQRAELRAKLYDETTD